MKVLLSAVSCNPYLGSENRVGWAAVRTLARDHELWVLVGRREEPDLERATAEGLVPANVHFVYAGEFQPYHPNRMRARLQSWREYQQFSSAILPVARQLHAQVHFDVAHHVNIATWRVASPLWQLGIPFVFGPIGGAEQFPARFFPILSVSATAFELARMASNVISRYSPAVGNTIRRAAHVFVANTETEKLAKTVRGSDAGVSRLMGTFFTEEKVSAFARFATDKNPDGPLRLFASGSIDGRKGVALALAALARIKKQGINFRYRLNSSGSETPHLKKLAGRLGLTSEIIFAENQSWEDYQRELGNTHVYLLPSLRDNAPATLTEAMLAGCVPVVADCGGPSFMVTEACGYKIPVVNRAQMVAQLADTLIAIDRNRQIILEKGRAASRRIATEFSEENYRARVNAIYRSLSKST